MELFVIWIAFALLVGAFGANREIGFWPSFLLSVILSPLVGLIIAAFSSQKQNLPADNITRLTSPGYQSGQPSRAFNAPIDPNLKKEAKSADITVARQISEWKILLDNGAITQEEYDEQKSKLLKF